MVACSFRCRSTTSRSQGFCIAFWILRVIVRSPFGQTLVGIRESESRMRTLGYHVWLHKYIGFVIAGGFGGFAGVLWAYYNGFVSPVDLQLATSVEVLLMVAWAAAALCSARRWAPPSSFFSRTSSPSTPIAGF